jgi:hypothetical protein
MSYPIFGAPAPVAPAGPTAAPLSRAATAAVTPAAAATTGRTSPGLTRSATADATTTSSLKISGSDGDSLDFRGVTGYAVPYASYNTIFGSMVTTERTSSPSAFSRRGALSRASSSASPISFADTAAAADSAAAAALRPEAP